MVIRSFDDTLTFGFDWIWRMMRSFEIIKLVPVHAFLVICASYLKKRWNNADVNRVCCSSLSVSARDTEMNKEWIIVPGAIHDQDALNWLPTSDKWCVLLKPHFDLENVVNPSVAVTQEDFSLTLSTRILFRFGERNVWERTIEICWELKVDL